MMIIRTERQEQGREMTVEELQEQGEDNWLEPMHCDTLGLQRSIRQTLVNMKRALEESKRELSQEDHAVMLEFALEFLVRRVLGKPFTHPIYSSVCARH